MPNVYHYDPRTFALLSVSPADESPLEKGQGVYLVPAHATMVKPPSVPAGKFACFDLAADKWRLRVIPEPEPEPEPVAVPEPVPPTQEQLRATLQATLDQAASLMAQLDATPSAE